MAPARPHDRWILLGLVALAVLLRLWHLGRDSLWLDEGGTWWNATLPTFRDAFFAEVNHGPIWWIVTRLSVALLGESEAALRMPAAIAGVLAVPGTYLLARRLAPAGPGLPDVGLFAALLAAVGGFWIEYSQEARMYSTLLLLAIVLSLLALAWARGGRSRTVIGYSLLATFGLYTHVLVIGPMMGHAVHALVRAARREPGAARALVGLALAQAAALLLYAPWVLRAIGEPTGLAASGRFGPLPRLGSALWRMAVGPAIVPFDTPRIAAGVGPFLADAAPALAFTAAVSIVAVGLGARHLVRRHGEATLALAGLLAPIVLLLVAQSRVPLMHEKYLVASTPFLAALAAIGARRSPPGLRSVLTALLLVPALAGATAYHLRDWPPVAGLARPGHLAGKESWRELQQELSAGPRAAEPVVLHPAYLDRAWNFYDRGAHHTMRLKEIPSDSADLVRRLPELDTTAPVTFILSHVDSSDRARLLDVIGEFAGRSPAEIRAAVELHPRQFGIRTVRVDGRRTASAADGPSGDRP